MGEWGDAPLTFDRSSEAWGSVSAGFDEGGEGEGGGVQYLELIGSELWVAGMADLGRFRRVSDFVNVLQGYMVLRDAVVLSSGGETTRVVLPELRVLPDDIAIVGQLGDDTPQAPSGGGAFIEKRPHRLVLLTRSHMIDGEIFIQVDGSVMAFVEATDPKFIPMSDVRVHRLGNQQLAARYPFALVQRTQVLGVATEGIKPGGAEETMRRAAMRQAQATTAPDRDTSGMATESPAEAAGAWEAPEGSPAEPSGAPAEER